MKGRKGALIQGYPQNPLLLFPSLPKQSRRETAIITADPVDAQILAPSSNWEPNFLPHQPLIWLSLARREGVPECQL